MNWLDLLLLTIFVFSVLNGILRGFFSLSIGLGATVLGILCASWFYGLPAAMFEPFVKHETLANCLGFLAVMVAVQLAGFALVWILVKVSKKAGLGWLDRTLGAGFGALRALLISIVLVMVLTAFPLRPASTAVQGSRFAPYVIESARILVYLTPHEIRDGFHRNYEKIQEAWKKTLKNTINETAGKSPKSLNF
jgi:membrane protein required for colicin V production